MVNIVINHDNRLWLNNYCMPIMKRFSLIEELSTALAKNHAKPAKGDTSHVTKMNIFRFSQLIMS